MDPVTNEIIPEAKKEKRNRTISTSERESVIQSVRQEARKDIGKLTTELNQVRDELSRVSEKLMDFKESVSEALQRVQKVDQ